MERVCCRELTERWIPRGTSFVEQRTAFTDVIIAISLVFLMSTVHF